MKMKWTRRQYLKFLQLRKIDASTLIQKYIKGYVVYKEWGVLLHNTIINSMTDHFRKIKI